MQNKGVNVFEGFDFEGAAIGYDQKSVPNVLRILSDFDSHAFYNLHGCVDWQVEEHNVNNLPGYQYFLSTTGIIDNTTATIEIERGKNILLTNIITGQQKVQRTAISPFRQMLSAFDIDTHNADKLFIIGYSYSDEHINDIIRNARKYNTNLEIFLINPVFDDRKFMFEFLSHWGKPKNWIYKNDEVDEISSPDYGIKIIKRRFSEYLQKQSGISNVSLITRSE